MLQRVHAIFFDETCTKAENFVSSREFLCLVRSRPIFTILVPICDETELCTVQFRPKRKTADAFNP
ncbi:hypothetical protein WN48_00170 [Eufriesea mexicana]|nr:hypothetical protein WN48_00170 [Eufriesea mexicana]